MKANRKVRCGRTGGFTLVELMVVISIIAVLAAIVGFRVVNAMDDGNVAAAKAQLKEFDTALVAYKIKFKKYPENLDALVSPPEGESILTAKSIPLDPWGNPYVYQLESSRKYTVLSYGADGATGGEDVDRDLRSDDAVGVE